LFVFIRTRFERPSDRVVWIALARLLLARKQTNAEAIARCAVVVASLFDAFASSSFPSATRDSLTGRWIHGRCVVQRRK